MGKINIDKENQKKTFEDIMIEVNLLVYTDRNKSKVLSKATSLLFEVGKLTKKVSKSDISAMFDNIYHKFEDDSYKFLLKTFMILVKNKSKNENANQIDVNNIIHEKILIYTKNILNEYELSEIEIDSLSGFQLADYQREPDFIKSIFVKFFEATYAKNNKISRENFASIIYIFILSRNFKRHDYLELTLLIERLIAEEFSQLNKKKLSKRLWIDVPKILLSRNSKPQFEKLTYLFFGVTDQLNMLQNEKQYVIQKQINDTETISNLKIKINKLLDDNYEKDNEIMLLKKNNENYLIQQVESENRLKFEKNKYEMQYVSLKDSLKNRLTKQFSLEIQGIEDIIQNFQEKEKIMLQRRIGNLNQIINKIGDN